MGDPTLGETVKEARRRSGRTQRAVADAVGIDTSYLSKIENDQLEHTPSVRTLVALATVLDLDELALLDAADKVPPPMQALTRSPEALRFLQRAAREIQSPEGWDALTRFLDDQQRGLGRQ